MSSQNRKLGNIPASTSSDDTCPSTCSLKGTNCYARFGPLGIHWRKVSNGERGSNWDSFCERVKRFPKGQLWRHSVAGDLPGHKNRLNKTMCLQLAKANIGRRGFTYTHYRPTKHNLSIIRQMNQEGFTVNLSADNLTYADAYAKMGLPTVVILPMDTVAPVRTPEGRTVVICPAQTHEHITCASCQLCQVSKRESIVGFLAHGSVAKRLSEKLR